MTLNKFKGDIMLIIYDLIGFFSLYLILSNADIKFGKKQFLLTFSLQKKYWSCENLGNPGITKYIFWNYIFYNHEYKLRLLVLVRLRVTQKSFARINGPQDRWKFFLIILVIVSQDVYDQYLSESIRSTKKYCIIKMS